MKIKYRMTFHFFFCRVMCFILAMLTIGAAWLLPDTLPHVCAAKTVSIPSPMDYFGELSDSETGINNTAFYFYGYPDLPREAMQAYVEALEEFGLTSDTSTVGSLVNLKTNGKTYVQLSWLSGSKYNGGYLRVNIVQPYTADEPTGERVSASTTNAVSKIILSPDHYFGNVDGVERGSSSSVLSFDGFRKYPAHEMQEYVEAFKAAGFTGFIVARSNGDREAVMKFDGIDCVWLLWDKSEQCVRLEMLNSLPSDDDMDADESLPDRMDRWLGTPKNVEYNSDEEYLVYDFGYSSYPTSKVNSFLKELQALGFSAGDRSVISSGTSLQKVYWNDETCLLIWWLPKTNKLEITIYRDVAEDANAFREADIPKPTEPEPKPTEPEPKPTEYEPTIPTTDSPNAVSNIVRNIFGTPFKTVYKEDRYETRMYFRSAAEPKSAFSSFQLKMESFGLRVKGSNFSGSKEVGAKAEGGTPVMASWKKKSGEIEVTIKWEYVLKAGVFDTGDVPDRTPQETQTSPDEDKVRCNVCFGDGKCPKCKGSGEIEESLHGKPNVKVTQICNRCWGTKNCDSCDKGWVDP